MFKILVTTVASRISHAASVTTTLLEFDDIGRANVAFECLARQKAIHDVHCVVTVSAIKLY